MPPFLRSKPVIIVGAIVLGLIIVAGILFSVLPRGPKAEAAAKATSTPSQSVLYADDAPAAAKAISRLSTEPEKVLSTTALKALGGDARKALPTGTIVKPLPKTWNAVGDGTASMLAAVTYPGSKTASPYLVYLAKEKGSWKVLGTVEVKVDKK